MPNASYQLIFRFTVASSPFVLFFVLHCIALYCIVLYSSIYIAPSTAFESELARFGNRI